MLLWVLYKPDRLLADNRTTYLFPTLFENMLDRINNIVYIRVHEQQRTQTVADAARYNLRHDEGLAPQGLAK
jgi:hypothetical protein